MIKSRILATGIVVVAAVAIGGGAVYYTQQGGVQKKEALSEEEAREFLSTAFKNMDEADLTLKSTVRYVAGSGKTYNSDDVYQTDEGTENYDCIDFTASDTDSYYDKIVDVSAQYSDNEMHGAWTYQQKKGKIDESDEQAFVIKSEDGEYYATENEGVQTEYWEINDEDWMISENTEVTSVGDMYNLFLTDGVVTIEAQENDEGYEVSGSVLYEDAIPFVSKYTGSNVGIAEDDISVADTNFVITINKDKKITSMHIETQNKDNHDVDGDGIYVDYWILDINFDVEKSKEVIKACLLTTEKKQSIEAKIQTVEENK